MKIYFIRHGESQANSDNVAAGWYDSPLTEKGIKQAYDAASTIRSAGYDFTTIISSPLSRAFETAKIIATGIGIPPEAIVTLDDLRERNVGSYAAKPLAELYSATEREQQTNGVESFSELAERVRRCNAPLVRLSGARTLVVGHSGYYRVALMIEQRIKPENAVTIPKPLNGTIDDYPL